MDGNEVFNLVYEILEKYEFEQRKVIGTYTAELKETLQVLVNYKHRLDEIESIIREHSIGVNNVYQKFTELENIVTIQNIRKLHKKLSQLIIDFDAD